MRLTKETVAEIAFECTDNEANGYEPSIVQQLGGDLADALAEIDRLRAAMTWQPIETAPKDGTVVLLWGRSDGIARACWSDRQGRWYEQTSSGAAIEYMSDFGVEYRTVEVPSHWLPLPCPPEAAQ